MIVLALPLLLLFVVGFCVERMIVAVKVWQAKRQAR
jgi:hypothetical protein